MSTERVPFGQFATLVATLSSFQRPGDFVSTEDDAGRQGLRANELECTGRGSRSKKAFTGAQQDWVDGQHDFICKPMFEQD